MNMKCFYALMASMLLTSFACAQPRPRRHRAVVMAADRRRVIMDSVRVRADGTDKVAGIGPAGRKMAAALARTVAAAWAIRRIRG